MYWRVTIQMVMIVMVAMNSLSITSTINASPTNESGEHIEDSVISTTINLPGRSYVNYNYDQFFNLFPCYIIDIDKENIDDIMNEMVRELAGSNSDIISTIAGSGSTTYGGDNGAATSAAINYPNGVALDVSGRPRHLISFALF